MRGGFRLPREIVVDGDHSFSLGTFRQPVSATGGGRLQSPLHPYGLPYPLETTRTEVLDLGLYDQPRKSPGSRVATLVVWGGGWEVQEGLGRASKPSPTLLAPAERVSPEATNYSKYLLTLDSLD